MTTMVDRSTVLGVTEPRLWTKPLRELTPETSAGFAAIEFATQVIGMRLLPWQEWWLIHALELREDGRFRFSVVLTLVSRQNGKTRLLGVVVMWFLYVRARTLPHPGLVVSSAQDLRIAREFWQANVDIAQGNDDLNSEIVSIRYGNGDQCLTVNTGARYKLTAATRGAGRGLSTDCLVLDELREQRTRAPWAALQNTTAARSGAITFAISNQGDDESVVLNDLRSAALSETDPSVGIFEWSAPNSCDPNDIQAWAQANPALGRTLTEEKLRSIRATSSDSDWRTENLCQRVDTLDAAIDPEAWRDCGVAGLSLAAHREQLVACVDVGVDSGHVTLALAAVVGDPGPIVHGEVAGTWTDAQSARRDFPRMLARIRPRALGWYPGGVAGMLGVEIAAAHGTTCGSKTYDGEFRAHSPGVVDITGSNVTSACMAFADLVQHYRFRHRQSPLLDDHIASCARYDAGETGAWRFARKGKKPIDAAYAMAGAVHLARSLPPFKPVPKSRIF